MGIERDLVAIFLDISESGHKSEAVIDHPFDDVITAFGAIGFLILKGAEGEVGEDREGSGRILEECLDKTFQLFKDGVGLAEDGFSEVASPLALDGFDGAF